MALPKLNALLVSFPNTKKLALFSVSANGSLTRTFTSEALTYSPYGLALDSTGKFAYVAAKDSPNSSLFTFEITSIDTIALVREQSTENANDNLKLSETDRFLYTMNWGSDNSLTQYEVQASGVLNSIETYGSQDEPHDMAFISVASP